jgi:hypothetical protein
MQLGEELSMLSLEPVAPDVYAASAGTGKT